MGTLSGASTEDITAQGRRLVAEFHAVADAMERARRYVEGLDHDTDPTRREVAAELIPIIGVACVLCSTRCVPGPVCDSCTTTPTCQSPGGPR